MWECDHIGLNRFMIIFEHFDLYWLHTPSVSVTDSLLWGNFGHRGDQMMLPLLHFMGRRKLKQLSFLPTLVKWKRIAMPSNAKPNCSHSYIHWSVSAGTSSQIIELFLQYLTVLACVWQCRSRCLRVIGAWLWWWLWLLFQLVMWFVRRTSMMMALRWICLCGNCWRTCWHCFGIWYDMIMVYSGQGKGFFWCTTQSHRVYNIKWGVTVKQKESDGEF